MTTIPTRFSLSTRSPEEAADLLSTAYAPVEVRAFGPAFDLDVQGIACGGLTVYRTRSMSGVEFRSELPFDGYNLAVALSGGQIAHSKTREIGAHRPGEALAVDGAAIDRVRFMSDLEFKGVSISTESMHACLSEMIGRPVTGRIRFAASPGTDGGAVRLMLMLADALFAGMEGDAPLAQAPAATASLGETIAKLMLEGIPNSFTEQLRKGVRATPSPGHVVRAIEYMRAHVGEPIGLAEIARAAGTSPRSLQEGFRRFKETTPVSYLRGLRLQGSRADLLDPKMPASVTSIATRWGFAHMGMFAAYYRSAFGETPKQTLAARRIGRKDPG